MIKREVVVIGGGPAGLSAAAEAARAGASVLVCDENRRAGGQLFKQIHKFFGSKAHSAGVRGIDIAQRLLRDVQESGAELWLESPVVGIFDGKRVAVLRSGAVETVQADRILISTGGGENPLRFPGWTLPGVMGAGAAQTMANVNRVLPGRKILMVGSGNVGVIVAYQLMQAGAQIVGVLEGMDRVGAYGVHAAKLRRAGVPFFLSHTIVRAEGEECVQRAVIGEFRDGKVVPGTETAVDTDVICLAVGMHPMTELAWMAGVRQEYVRALGGWMPMHDETMQTNLPGVYVAGDTAGVEEANTAMDEGRLAGVAIAASLGYLDGGAARAAEEEIRDRLVSLRQGPFGERRLEAKREIMRKGAAE